MLTHRTINARADLSPPPDYQARLGVEDRRGTVPVTGTLYGDLCGRSLTATSRRDGGTLTLELTIRTVDASPTCLSGIFGTGYLAELADVPAGEYLLEVIAQYPCRGGVSTPPKGARS